MTVCAHPGCTVKLWRDNSTGVCRAHNHLIGCRCGMCDGAGRIKWRVKARAEMVTEGLLPEKPIFPLSL